MMPGGMERDTSDKAGRPRNRLVTEDNSMMDAKTGPFAVLQGIVDDFERLADNLA